LAHATAEWLREEPSTPTTTVAGDVLVGDCDCVFVLMGLSFDGSASRLPRFVPLLQSRKASADGS